MRMKWMQYPNNNELLTLQSGHNATAIDLAFSTTSQMHIVWSKWLQRIFFTLPSTFISERHIQQTSFASVDCLMSFGVASVNLLAICVCINWRWEMKMFLISWRERGSILPLVEILPFPVHFYRRPLLFVERGWGGLAAFTITHYEDNTWTKTTNDQWTTTQGVDCVARQFSDMVHKSHRGWKIALRTFWRPFELYLSTAQEPTNIGELLRCFATMTTSGNLNQVEEVPIMYVPSVVHRCCQNASDNDKTYLLPLMLPFDGSMVDDNMQPKFNDLSVAPAPILWSSSAALLSIDYHGRL